jgi:hypothetical protein
MPLERKHVPTTLGKTVSLYPINNYWRQVMADTELGILDKAAAQLTEDQKKKLEEIIEEEEGITRKVKGFWNIIISMLAVAMSLFAIYTAVFPVTTQIVRGVHVGFLLAISFLFYPISKKYKGRINIFDILLSLAGIACIAYMLHSSHIGSNAKKFRMDHACVVPYFSRICLCGTVASCPMDAPRL